MQISYRKAVQFQTTKFFTILLQETKKIYRHIGVQGVQYMSLRRPTVCQYRERELT